MIAVSEQSKNPREATHAGVLPARETLVETDRSPISTVDLPPPSTISEKDLAKARARYAMIKPALDAGRPYLPQLQIAAAQNNCSLATLYSYIERYEWFGDIRSLVDRGIGERRKIRIDPRVDAIIVNKFETMYAVPQRCKASKVCEAVQLACYREGLPRPHDNTIRNRLSRLKADMGGREFAIRRGEKKLADAHTPYHGVFSGYDSPWSLVQIDHTKLDVMLVSEETREPIGRAFITVVYDVYSRMFLGICISLDPVGTLTTGLGLYHAMVSKDEWLADRGVTNPWDTCGKPAALHFDNAKEFLGRTIQRFCEVYDVRIEHRALGNPRYGGHIERVIRTMNEAIHVIPGTTFYNIEAKGQYKAEKLACMTLFQCEGYVAEWITGPYHQSIHRGLRRTPLSVYNKAILGSKESFAIGRRRNAIDERRLRLDLLPVEYRTIQKDGVHWDNMVYVGDVLGPYTCAQNEDGTTTRFSFSRDPRRINECYFYAPKEKRYHQLTLRNPARQPISKWEWDELLRRLRAEGKKDYDEDAVFASLDRLEHRRNDAIAKTIGARRDRERTLHHSKVGTLQEETCQADELDWTEDIKSFEDDQ